MNIKDLDLNTMASMLESLEAKNPSLLKSLYKDASDDAEKRKLCQIEANLSADLAIASNELASKQNLLNEQLKKIHQTYDKAISIAKQKVMKIQTQLDAVHKEYVLKFPAKKFSCESSCLHAAFNLLYGKYQTVDGIGYCKEYKSKMFKHFCNLVKGKCKMIEMFGYDWDIISVGSVLDEEDHDLASEVMSVWYDCTR